MGIYRLSLRDKYEVNYIENGYLVGYDENSHAVIDGEKRPAIDDDGMFYFRSFDEVIDVIVNLIDSGIDKKFNSGLSVKEVRDLISIAQKARHLPTREGDVLRLTYLPMLKRIGIGFFLSLTGSILIVGLLKYFVTP